MAEAGQEEGRPCGAMPMPRPGRVAARADPRMSAREYRHERRKENPKMLNVAMRTTRARGHRSQKQREALPEAVPPIRS